MPKNYFVRGIFHPPLVRDEKYKGFMLKESELAIIIKQYKNKPIKFEHQGDQIGKITGFTLGKNGELICDMSLMDGKHIEEMRDGKKYGLSIGYDAIVNERQERVGCIPEEISIVAKPAMGTTMILAYGTDDRVDISESAYNIIERNDHKKSQTMTEAQPASAIDDFKTMTADQIKALINDNKAMKSTLQKIEDEESTKLVQSFKDELDKLNKFNPKLVELMKTTAVPPEAKDSHMISTHENLKRNVKVCASFNSTYSELEAQYQQQKSVAKPADVFQEEVSNKKQKTNMYEAGQNLLFEKMYGSSTHVFKDEPLPVADFESALNEYSKPNHAQL